MIGYTSEEEIRHRVALNAESQARAHGDAGAVDAAVIERFIKQRVRAAKELGTLMSAQQLRDWRAKRVLQVGDTARYVGDSRTESVVVDGVERLVERPHGQEGVIADVQVRGDYAIVTFRPTLNAALKDELLVELTVRQGTPGYTDLERVP